MVLDVAITVIVVVIVFLGVQELGLDVEDPVEVEGARKAHIRDGAAVSKFLAWMAREAPNGHLSEIDVAEMLEGCRRENGALTDLSFDSISGAGEHAALPHYRVTRSSNRTINKNEIYLIDSGGQYPDGTTDITRTMIVGTPTAEMKDRFTRVLKGHISLATVRFPEGTTGAHLDTLARRPLWDAGCDYDHGTGHGVGAYLSVHEGPQRIAKTGTVALEPGMIISNEPGYYKAGDFGIRIENLVCVEPRKVKGAERDMLGRLAADKKLAVHPGVARLQHRIRDLKREMLTFLDIPGLPADNNQAERDLRYAVILRKLSFQTRSDRGSRTMADMLTVSQTARKQDVPLAPFLASLDDARCRGRAPPGLLGTR